MSKPKQRLNLTEEEFADCVELYEKSVGSYWLPLYCKEQDLWVRGFEEAKIYFSKESAK